MKKNKFLYCWVSTFSSSHFQLLAGSFGTYHHISKQQAILLFLNLRSSFRHYLLASQYIFLIEDLIFALAYKIIFLAYTALIKSSREWDTYLDILANVMKWVHSMKLSLGVLMHGTKERRPQEVPVSILRLTGILGRSNISRSQLPHLHGKRVRLESVMSTKMVLLPLGDIWKYYGLSRCMCGV